MVTVKVKYLHQNAEPISYAKEGDAGIDLRASGVWVFDLDTDRKEIVAEQYIIKPGERILIKTGVQIELPQGYWGNLRDRSGLAGNHGLHTLSGVLDETYRGEIMVVMVNLGMQSYTIHRNERVAQLIISCYERASIVASETLSTTQRGETGFGHSGRQ